MTRTPDYYAELWTKRIKEIKETGNVIVNPARPQKYFHDQGKNRYTVEDMIAYCEAKVAYWQGESLKKNNIKL